MVIELPLHQPETTQCRGSLPPAVWTPSFWEDPARRCCDPRGCSVHSLHPLSPGDFSPCTPRSQTFCLAEMLGTACSV